MFLRLPACFNTQPPEGGCRARGRSRTWPPGFNTQPPEGGCLLLRPELAAGHVFQHTAARRRLRQPSCAFVSAAQFQHTAARRRLLALMRHVGVAIRVSTHSRPKAAATPGSSPRHAGGGFNTQPPEGGCKYRCGTLPTSSSFNTQPPEGGCSGNKSGRLASASFNTQPPEGGCARCRCAPACAAVSTHSRPKAAAHRHHQNHRRH